jgi:hypothetical protein
VRFRASSPPPPRLLSHVVKPSVSVLASIIFRSVYPRSVSPSPTVKESYFM